MPVFENVPHHIVGEALRFAVGGEAAIPQPGHAAAERPDPQVAVGVFVDGADEIAGESVLLGIGSERAVGEPAQAVVGAEPHRSIARPSNGAHHVADKAVLSREHREAVVLEAVDPSPVGAYPERAVRVLGEGPHDVVREPLFLGVGRERAGLEANEAAAVERRPHAAVMCLVDGAQHRVMGPARRLVAIERAVTEAAQDAFVGANPHPAVTTLEDRPDHVARQAVDHAIPAEPSAAESVHAIDRACPHTALVILEQRMHGRRPCGVRVVDGEATVGQTDQSSLRTDPEIAVAILL